jgi:hypothetical protein
MMVAMNWVEKKRNTLSRVMKNKQIRMMIEVILQSMWRD